MDVKLTDRQLDLMNFLWEQGSATVREAKEKLDDDLAYTSVLTVFQTLEKNGTRGIANLQPPTRCSGVGKK